MSGGKEINYLDLINNPDKAENKEIRRRIKSPSRSPKPENSFASFQKKTEVPQNLQSSKKPAAQFDAFSSL